MIDQIYWWVGYIIVHAAMFLAIGFTTIWIVCKLIDVAISYDYLNR